jgi:hypothetical protein
MIVSGAMQLTRTPAGPAWAAASWVSSSTPALSAADANGEWALGRSVAADEIVTMLPDPRAFIPGRKLSSRKKVTVRFASMDARHPSSLSSSMGPGRTGLPPAFATSTSTGPKRCSISPRIRSTSA